MRAGKVRPTKLFEETDAIRKAGCCKSQSRLPDFDTIVGIDGIVRAWSDPVLIVGVLRLACSEVIRITSLAGLVWDVQDIDDFWQPRVGLT